MSYEIHVNSLIGCPYSERVEQELNNLPNVTINKVTYSNKSQYLNDMKTFPQIYLKKGFKKYKIGGCDDLLLLLNLIKVNKKSKSLAKKIKKKFNLKNKHIYEITKILTFSF